MRACICDGYDTLACDIVGRDCAMWQEMYEQGKERKLRKPKRYKGVIVLEVPPFESKDGKTALKQLSRWYLAKIQHVLPNVEVTNYGVGEIAEETQEVTDSGAA